MYKSVIRPLLFTMSPEKAHHFTTSAFKTMLKIPGMKGIFRSMYCVEDDRLKRKLFGLEFKNPVGLAAGFDKQADLYNDFANLGFGFIEVGTITPKGQAGNPQPRMFRLPKDQGLINRMGFNNEGVEAAINNLRERRTDIVIGGNIGKNKVTADKDAVLDYEKCFEALFAYVDYFVVNVSSPNTPGLRGLQDKEPLKEILNRLMQLNKKREKSKPILLKIAPDLENDKLDDIIEVVLETNIDGVIATNTTISREGLVTDKSITDEAGGVSGKPVKDRSTEIIRYLAQKSNSAFPIVGVGGIQTAEDAIEKLEAGASLVQVYTGFIYEGPSMVKRINKGLLKRMR